MKKIFLFAAAAAALVSCNKNVFQGTGSEELYGSISLGVNAESEMLVTKAASVMDADALASYNITLTKIGTEGYVWDHREYSSIKDWKVPAGEYSLEVENYTIEEAQEGKGAVRVLGTKNFTVEAGKATNVSVNCDPQNSRLSFAADAAFNSVFSSATVSVTEPRTDTESREVDLGTPAQEHKNSISAYFEPVTVNWTLTATTALSDTPKTFTGTVTLVKAKWNQVTFTTKNGAINITVSVDGEITAVESVNETIDPLPNK